MLRGELTSLGDDGKYVVEVDFGTEGGTRKVPAHVEVANPLGGYHSVNDREMRNPISMGSRTVPDDMPGYAFYETLTGWVAARHRE